MESFYYLRKIVMPFYVSKEEWQFSMFGQSQETALWRDFIVSSQ